MAVGAADAPEDKLLCGERRSVPYILYAVRRGILHRFLCGVATVGRIPMETPNRVMLDRQLCIAGTEVPKLRKVTCLIHHCHSTCRANQLGVPSTWY
jgi:hypothetical protein